MSVVAVVLAAGGTSYAAVQLGKNSVRSKHIKNGEVKRSDIARGAVDSRRIANGTVAAEDLAPSAKTAGPQGPRAPTRSISPSPPQGATQRRCRCR